MAVTNVVVSKLLSNFNNCSVNERIVYSVNFERYRINKTLNLSTMFIPPTNSFHFLRISSIFQIEFFSRIFFFFVQFLLVEMAFMWLIWVFCNITLKMGCKYLVFFSFKQLIDLLCIQ